MDGDWRSDMILLAFVTASTGTGVIDHISDDSLLIILQL